MAQDLSDFVYIEAKEKAFEIEIESRKQFESKREAILKTEKAKLLDDFRNKEEAKTTEYRIAHSTMINQARTDLLIARNKSLLKLLNLTQIKLLKRIKEDHLFYKELLQGMILQGLVKMMEPKVIVKCLNRDKHVVKEVLDNCIFLYKKVMKTNLPDQECQCR